MNNVDDNTGARKSSYDYSGRMTVEKKYNYNTVTSAFDTYVDDGDGTYAYDKLGRLTRFTQLGSDGDDWLDYSYDVLGRRIFKKVTSDGGSTFDEEKYFYDGNDVICDYDDSATPVLKKRYLTPGLDENMIMWDEDFSGDPFYYFHDGLGSVRNILDASGNEKNAYDYKAFGEALGTPTETVDNRYQYTGREKDATDHYYYRARYYRPSQGRFGSTDPIFASNLYLYCKSNPILLKDPSGRITIGPKKVKDSSGTKIGTTTFKYERIQRAVIIYNPNHSYSNFGSFDDATTGTIVNVTTASSYVSIHYGTKVEITFTPSNKYSTSQQQEVGWIQFAMGKKEMLNKRKKKIKITLKKWFVDYRLNKPSFWSPDGSECVLNDFPGVHIKMLQKSDNYYTPPKTQDLSLGMPDPGSSIIETSGYWTYQRTLLENASAAEKRLMRIKQKQNTLRFFQYFETYLICRPNNNMLADQPYGYWEWSSFLDYTTQPINVYGDGIKWHNKKSFSSNVKNIKVR